MTGDGAPGLVEWLREQLDADQRAALAVDEDYRSWEVGSEAVVATRTRYPADLSYVACGPYGGDVVAEYADHIEEWITDAGRTASAAELAEAFPGVKRATLDSNLSRMVKRGTLTKVTHGHYALPGDGESCTPRVLPLVQEVQEAQERQSDLALLADLASCEVPERVQERPQGPAGGDSP